MIRSRLGQTFAARRARPEIARTGLGWRLAMAAAGLLAALSVLLTQAPASFADLALSRATQGRVRLAEAAGTIWQGRGRIVFADVVEGGMERAATATIPGVVLPGIFGWRVSPWPLLVGVLDARVEHDSMRQAVLLTGRVGELRATPGTLTLPPVALDRLGSPWNTIRPTGALTLSWDSVTLRSGRFDGRASIELHQAASALTPVRPLGAYRIDVVGSGAQAQVKMNTLSGPLRLEGSGSWDARSGLRFTAEALAEGPERVRLQSLLGLLGRRVGERTIIKIGA
ncbi:MAG: type II secretion system protein N [Burkholderiales bacterium]|nr:MAG: type II secretion system protein N [Burkholderiales bacterium]